MKKNLTLYIAIALPLLFVIIVAIAIYIPTNFTNPQYKLVYTDDTYGIYKNNYVVESGKIVTKNNLELIKYSPEDLKYYSDSAKLYLYDFETNSSTEITLAEAQQYAAFRGPSSPDGYSVERNYSNAGIFEIFGSYDNRNQFFIVNSDGVREKIIGLQSDYYELNIVGWVK
jgi:hypothetical protein